MRPPVLVTGASGFIGAHVVAALAARGRRVVAVASPRAPGWKAPEGDVRVVARDVRDHAALARLVGEHGTGEVLHLAAAGVRGEATREDLFSVNVLAPLALARALAPVAGHRLVVAGTMFEHGDVARPLLDEPLLDEDSPLRPTTPYAASKAACTLALGAEGGRFTVLRLFHVYGPGEAATRLTSYAVARLVANEPVETTDLELVRDLVHVDDVARAFVLALESEAAVGRVVNVATGRATRLRDVVEWLANRTGGRHLLRFGARPHRPGEMPRLVGDPSLARELLGFEASVAWESGLERLLAGASRGA